MFITFEGIDLSGKSTQIKLLYDYLTAYFKNNIRNIIFVREPGGTEISEAIRDILLNNNFKGMMPLTEFFLFSASRYELTNRIIKPHLEKGDIVLCDRYYDSSTAYQGYGGMINIETILKINSLASDSLVPDVTFLIDIDVDEVIKRRIQSGKSKDRMEEKETGYFKKVVEGYRKLADINKNRFFLIDGNRDIQVIHNEILNIIKLKIINDKQ